MNITYRIPSKKVPYGYVEVTWEKADPVMPDPVTMAEDYAQFIKDYQKAEVAAFEKPSRWVKPDPAPEDDINDIASDLIKDGLGATEMSAEEAAKPWNKTGTGSMDGAETDTPTASKPWEGSAPADSDWDF